MSIALATEGNRRSGDYVRLRALVAEVKARPGHLRILIAAVP